MREFKESDLMFDYRLSKLIRYNHRHRIKNESVAEHSYYVVLYCLKICHDYGLDEATTNRVLIKAIVHDLPEIVTSDVPYDVKQNMPELNKLLEQAEVEFYRTKYPEYFDIIYNNDELEDLIVRYADALSVMQYSLNELSLSPLNADFLDIKACTIVRLEILKTKIESKLKGVKNDV